MSEDARKRAQAQWHYIGRERPGFAQAPGPVQESVWDYPRPPSLMLDSREVVVLAGNVELARTRRALRVLETASPPTFYLPPDDIALAHLVLESGSSYCEWKGRASYYGVQTQAQQLTAAAWSYLDPHPEYGALRGYIAFYPALLACFVAGERVRPQPGGFYGGWITPELVGPFKGEPGSGGW